MQNDDGRKGGYFLVLGHIKKLLLGWPLHYNYYFNLEIREPKWYWKSEQQQQRTDTSNLFYFKKDGHSECPHDSDVLVLSDEV